MDRRTLFTVQAGLLLFLGCVVLIAHFLQPRHRRDRGATWFAAGYLFSGVGLGLQAYRGMIPPILSILFGNGLFMLFGAFSARAIARTTGQKRDYFGLLLLLNLATIANYAYYTWWQPNVLLRTIEAVPVLFVMYLACIDLLRRNTDPVIKPAVNAMIVTFVAHIIPNFIRVALAWKYKVSDAWFSWAGIITIAGLALSYLWVGSLRMEAELEQRAMTDPLTGLFNRRALDMIAPRELQRGARKQLPCSALMMDIDRFKDINDTLGHGAGDASLCAVADTLRQSLRASDLATRLGGDEFFVMLPDTDEGTAAMVAERLRSAIAKIRLTTVTGEEFSVSASIGCATLRKEQLTVDDLLHASDILLYREKQIGRSGQGPDQGTGLGVTGGAHVQPSNA